MPTPIVVIIGAGFAGLNAAKTLARSGRDLQVVLIDRNNYHTFVPMLYQVATATLDPKQVVYPLRRWLRRMPSVRFLMAEVQQIDFINRVVQTDKLTITYNYLILATGSQSQYLGVPGAPDYALPMRTLEEAVALRYHILSCFERAAQTTQAEQLQQLLTFAIVGGGPTGVELAGALSELIRGPLRRDYPTLDFTQVRLVLVQSGDRLLASYPQHLSKYTAFQLQRLGVKVYLNSKVSQVTPTALHLEDGTTLSTATVIWTAGVTAATPTTQPTVATAAKNKIVVEPTLQLAERSQVYAVGDLAHVESAASLTGVAQEAIQQGKTAANNILRQLHGQSPQPFNYFNKGRLAIIARHTGVGEIGKFAFTGWLAWFLWLYVHLFYLPGIRNRLSVFSHWLRRYFGGEGTARLILPITELKHKRRQG